MRPNPATRCARADLHAVEGEVGEAGEHFRFRMAAQIAPRARSASSVAAAVAHQHHARAFERIAFLALVEHQRDARIGQDVLGVQRELRNSNSGAPSAAVVATLTSEQ